MHSGILWQVIYWSPIPVLAALITILLRRRLLREFPFFFTYVVLIWVRNVIGFVIFYSASGGFYSSLYVYIYYWVFQFLNAVFILLPIYELFTMHLFPRFHKVKFYRYVFSAAAIVAAGVATFAVYGESKLAAVAKASHVLDVVQVIALVSLVVLMQFMGRQWGRYEFAIALGLALKAVAVVILFVLYLKWGRGRTMPNLPSVAEALACLLWLVAFSRPREPLLVPSQPAPPEVLQEAQKWEQALKESLTTKKPPVNRVG